MLKAFVNEATARVEITTIGPLLIKSGYATVIGADMAPVLTYRNKHDEVYLPGSSLKGVFRSHIEKVANSLKPRVACNPLLTREDREGKDERNLYRVSCGRELEDTTGAAALYKASCPVCRAFGSTSYIGRLSVGDAYLDAEDYEEQKLEDYKEQKLIEHRDGIAIDRLTGGVSGNAKFDLETVTEGTTFTTTLRLRNFEIWQLGMLFVIVKDLEDELITLGSGRSRGLGMVRGGIRMKKDGVYPGGLALCTPRTVGDPKEKAGELWGLGRWLKEEKEAEAYGCDPNDMLTLSSKVAHVRDGVRNTRVFTSSALDDLKDRSIEAFVERMQQWELARIAPAGEGSR